MHGIFAVEEIEERAESVRDEFQKVVSDGRQCFHIHLDPAWITMRLD